MTKQEFEKLTGLTVEDKAFWNIKETITVATEEDFDYSDYELLEEME
ncbi:MAG: hypothetical protein NC344_07740 [Bacteroidales bacterium]|nr:hypothetical protein [Bacteroidales bacterium]MCM1147706.1 hypothetical protein [Bacteroidales bacterium]MCM1206765.1 hypothetical protein [Bacillota bacterium]MCM1510665.1 hypothetical protein [Clostridium sp.]